MVLKVIGLGKTTNRVNADRLKKKKNQRLNTRISNVARVMPYNLATQSAVHGPTASTPLGI